MKSLSIRSTSVCFALVILAVASSHAATVTKADNGSPTNLGNSASWVGGVQPTAADIALFNSTLTGTATSAAMGSARTWGQIQVTNPGATFTINAGSFLNLAGLNGVGIDMSAATTDFIFNVTSTLVGSQSWNVASGRTLTIGSGAITQSAGTTLSLGGAGTILKNGAAALTVSSGTFAFTGNLRQAGTGIITLNSGALGSGGTLTFSSGTVAYGAGNTDDISSRLVNSTGAMAIDTNGNNVTFNSSISSSNVGGLTKVGTGTLTLNAANSYLGNTTIGGATSAVNVGNAGAFSSGNIVIEGGTGLINATTDLTGANKLTNNLSLLNNLSNTSASLSLEYGGNVNLNGALRQISNNSSTGTNTFSGIISNDGGSGTRFITTGNIALSGINTYTGATEFRGDRALVVSQIGNSGVAGNMGAGSVIRFGSTNSATKSNLRYIGSGETNNRSLELNGTTGDVTIEQAGTGLLRFAGTVTTTGTGSKTLFLTGSTSGSGQLDGNLADNVTSGALSVTKTGSGVWNLTGTNTYTGATTVSAGTLLINGSSVSNVSVAGGGTLGGSGTITGSVSVAVGGILAPGNSPGILSTGNLSLAGSLSAQLGKAIPGGQPIAGTDYDQVNVTGSVTLTGGDLSLSILSGIQTDDLYFIVLNDSNDAITGIFATLNNVATDLSQGAIFTAGSQYFQISYTANSAGGTFTGGNDVALLAVPEPSTWALLGLGFGALVWRSGFRRRKL